MKMLDFVHCHAWYSRSNVRSVCNGRGIIACRLGNISSGRCGESRSCERAFNLESESDLELERDR